MFFRMPVSLCHCLKFSYTIITIMKSFEKGEKLLIFLFYPWWRQYFQWKRKYNVVKILNIMRKLIFSMCVPVFVMATIWMFPDSDFVKALMWTMGLKLDLSTVLLCKDLTVLILKHKIELLLQILLYFTTLFITNCFYPQWKIFQLNVSKTHKET